MRCSFSPLTWRRQLKQTKARYLRAISLTTYDCAICIYPEDKGMKTIVENAILKKRFQRKNKNTAQSNTRRTHHKRKWCSLICSQYCSTVVHVSVKKLQIFNVLHRIMILVVNQTRCIG